MARICVFQEVWCGINGEVQLKHQYIFNGMFRGILILYTVKTKIYPKTYPVRFSIATKQGKITTKDKRLYLSIFESLEQIMQSRLSFITFIKKQTTSLQFYFAQFWRPSIAI